MSRVILKNLNKYFGEVVAVQKLNLEIQEGEFFSILGPSGCGKTTTLRMIAGFEYPTSGQIFFDAHDVTFLPVHRRNTGMVFQNYALFPHMTVFENVAFGLQARKIAKPEIRRRVREALKLVELSAYEHRMIGELSGGQQQRVALARAVVIEPKILLLDEPLSNLDVKLREGTRQEIHSLQRRLGITTIYVTHDQEEALSLSDRIAVMNQGVCHQIGTPEEIYQQPKDSFVASFVGNSNILEGRIVQCDRDSALVEVAPGWQMQVALNGTCSYTAQETITISIRPENIELVEGRETKPNTFAGTIKNISYSGAFIDSEIEVHECRLHAKRLAGEADLSTKGKGQVLLHIHSSVIHILN